MRCFSAYIIITCLWHPKQIDRLYYNKLRYFPHKYLICLVEEFLCCLQFHLSSTVVAGVSSLGGFISVGAGSSLLLRCECVGTPAARTVWYHNHNIITHHPRFTRNHDDTLLINSNLILFSVIKITNT